MNLSNLLTYSRILMSAVLIYLLRLPSLGAAVGSLVLFVIAALTDYWDGLVARKRGETSALGAFLDPLADKILVLAAFWTFVSMGLAPLWMVAVITAREVLVTVARTAIFSRHSVAAILSGKFKAFAQMATGTLIIAFLAIDRSGTSLLAHPAARAAIWLLMAWTTASTVISGVQLAVSWTAVAPGQHAERMSAQIAVFLATLGGIGFLPGVPGLCGSLWGLGLAAVMPGNQWWLFGGLIGLTAVSVWVVTSAMQVLEYPDPPPIVIDEAIGMLLAIAWLPWRSSVIIPALLAFRLLDVTKPFGIRRLERLPGAWGVLADDAMCGVVVNVACQIAVVSGAL